VETRLFELAARAVEVKVDGCGLIVLMMTDPGTHLIAVMRLAVLIDPAVHVGPRDGEARRPESGR